MIDHLHRALAPVSDRAWHTIEAEAARTLRHFLAGRALVDVDGPHGWERSAEPIGRLVPVGHPLAEGVSVGVREVQPMVELRTPFRVTMTELDAIDRGKPGPDLAAVNEAGRLAALAEDQLIFGGNDAAHLAGIASASPHPPVPIPANYDDFPGAVARAVAALRRAGVEGPYAIALGPQLHTGVIETTEHGGYPLLDHVKLILGGPAVWAPAVDGAVVVSQRGGDYRLVIGQDLSIGYRTATADAVDLYIEESVTLVVLEERAAVGMVHP